MVLYKLYVFCSGMKFKMAATAGFSLILDPMVKMFFEHFSIGSNVNACPAVAAILDFRSASKNKKIVEDLPMIIPGQFGFN
jgi:hypothetical protein